MQIRIKATKIELTPVIKEYIQEKMDMLKKYLGPIEVIKAEFEVEKVTRRQTKGKVYRAEANLYVPGALLRVEKIEKNLNKAIDKVKDHLVRSIKRYKEKKSKL
jgi:putative sigma-54 modulation protein